MATQTIKNPADLDKAVARLGRLLSWVKNELARRQKSIDYHQSRIDALKVRSGEKVRDYEAQSFDVAMDVFDYVDDHRTELFAVGSNFRKLPTGRVGYDEAREGATEFPQGEDAAVAAIEAMLPPELANTLLKKEVRKSVLKAAIKDDPTLADTLASVIQIPSVDRFVIDPENSHDDFRRPVGWFKRLPVIPVPATPPAS